MSDLAPSISVLMPAYNTERYIAEAIDSVLSQTFSDFELIIDDCSPGKSWEIVQEFAKKDKRIVAFRSETLKDIVSSRNRLIEKSRGRYIAWMDSDDICVPQRLEHQFQYMETHPDVGICGGWLEFFDESGKTGTRKYLEHDEGIRKTVFKYSPVSQPASIVRKSALKQAGLFDYNYSEAEDLDMSLRIGKVSQFANLQEVVLRYRENLKGGTFTRLRMMEFKTISIRLRYLDNKFYFMSLSDYIYNVIHFITIFVFPAKFKIRLFALFRNSK